MIPEKAKEGRAALRHLAAFAAMTLFSVLQTWPLIPLRKTHILGADKDDCWVNPWHEDWWRDSVVHWHTPFKAPNLHWPMGAELYWHSMSPAKSLWGLLLPWIEIIDLTNLITFWTFPLAGMTAWWLVRDVLRRGGHTGLRADVAAFAGACVFTFSRYHYCHSQAHANLGAIEGIPFYIFAVLRYFEERRPRWLFLVAFGALYAAGCELYYLYYVAIFFLFWLVATIWRDGPLLARASLKHPLIRPAIVVALVSGIGALPMVLPLLMHLKPAPWSIHGDATYPADPLMLFVPDSLSQWTILLPNSLAHAFWKLQKGILNDNEGGLFVGFAAPILGIIAYRSAGASLKPWIGTGFVFFLLSFGCYLNIGGVDTLPPQIVLVFLVGGLCLSPRVRKSVRGREVIALLALLLVLGGLSLAVAPDGLSVRIPMPYLFFKQIAPLYNRGGMAVRFLLMTQLSLAVLVGFGTLEIMRRMSKRGVRWELGAAALAILAINVETANKPFAMSYVAPLPPIFDTIRDDPENIAVYTDHVLSEWEQLHYRRPISFARQSRTPQRERPLVEAPLNRALVEFDFGDPSPSDVEAMRASLAKDHFKYFVGHHRHAAESIVWKKLPPDIDASRHRFLTETLGGRVVYNDDNYEVVQFW